MWKCLRRIVYLFVSFSQDEQKQFATALLLAIAFSANIGGVGTLTGTGTNIIFAGQALK